MNKNPPSPKPGQTAAGPKPASAGPKPGGSAAAAPGAAGHTWKGEAVEERDVAGRSESAEEAARRAQGNAPVAAKRASDATSAPGTFDWKHPHPDSPLDDEAARHENEEEKRQAAAEEHAADSPKHAPHGRL
jgi:hypothetical protein